MCSNKSSHLLVQCHQVLAIIHWKDKFSKQIITLALFTDDDSKYNKDQYHYHFFGTKCAYQYNTYRIATQSEEELLQSNNPFALAVLAGLYVIQGKKNKDLRLPFKRKLMQLLLQDKMNKKGSKRPFTEKLLVFIALLYNCQKKRRTS